MISGIYTAGSALINRGKSIDVISNNMANSNTTGFKRDGLATTSFGDHIVYRMSGNESAEIGGMNYGSAPGVVFTSYEQGALEQTGRTVDLGIEGNGFFTLQLEDGSTALTRSGQFQVNAEGNLVDGKGSLVMGQNGPITVGTANFEVRTNGEIFADGQTIDTLLVTIPTDNKALVKISDGMYRMEDGAETAEFTGKIRQGYLERSNVNVTEEMANIIAESRAYQTCSQMIKMMDQVLQKTVNELGRV